MSGVSSDNINPIRGWYGYVMIGPYFEFSVWHHPLDRFTLCRACPASRLYFYVHWSATISRPGSLLVGWASLLSDPDERAFVSDILFLGFFRPGWLRPKFDIDHASHVSFNASMASMWPLFLMFVLMELSSLVIWDRNKVITAISAAIWVINFGFQLAGEFTSSNPCESQRIWFDIRCR